MYHVPIKIKKLSDKATIPTRGSDKAAGHDLYSAVDEIIPPQEWKLIKTNIAIAIPDWHYGRIAPRSGLALKHGIEIMAGVVDGDYRGDVGVIIFNKSKEPFEVKVGDRIAQLIIEMYRAAFWTEVDELEDSSRGEGGFGSTGA